MSERYELIDAEKDAMTETNARKYTITQMCGWLEVSTSGYCEWRGRPASATAQRRAALAAAVARTFDESDETYGHRLSTPSSPDRAWSARPNWSER